MEWTRGFPKTEGQYWFYGYRYAGERKIEMCMMEVWKVQNGFLYVVNGQFLSPSEAGDFYVKEMELPILPKMAPTPLISYNEASK